MKLSLGNPNKVSDLISRYILKTRREDFQIFKELKNDIDDLATTLTSPVASDGLGLKAENRGKS
jgi:hypothetical protein